MGNLADELADAFSDSGDECDDSTEVAKHIKQSNERSSGATSANGRANYENTLAGPSPFRTEYHPKDNQDGGSDYGSETDLNESGIPPDLVAKINAVELLARSEIEDHGRPGNSVFGRIIDCLRDLGSQSSVESSASRLITAHTALTTYLNHQTRQLHSLTFPILSPLAPTPEPEFIDNLIPMLVSLSDSMPRPSMSALNALTTLHTVTADIVVTLNYLTDNLHMSRQTTATATRRLRNARELLSEIRQEDELREEGESWLSRGNWGERLRKRECAGICGDVIGGFEEVCNGWRERLLAQAQSQA